MKIVLASSNAGKLVEFQELLEPLGIDLILASALNINMDDVVEDGESFTDNAIIKAEYVKKHTKLPVLADDSGLVLKAFPKLLGVHTARFMSESSYRDRNKKILEIYGNMDKRDACFSTSLVYIDKHPEIFIGEINGSISHEIKGEQGFGYDPIFIPHGGFLTFAEMGLVEKNKISHRSIAFNNFLNYLKEVLR